MNNSIVVGISGDNIIRTNRNFKYVKNLTLTDMLETYHTNWDILRFENIDVIQLVEKYFPCKEIIFDNGKKIIVTSNCKIFAKNKDDYIEVKDLTSDDLILCYYPTPYSNIEKARIKETFMLEIKDVTSDIYKIIGTVNNNMFINDILVQCENIDTSHRYDKAERLIEE